MSTQSPGEEERIARIRELSAAGRELSDAAVMYHTALGERLGLGPSHWKTLGLLEQHGALAAGDIAARTGLAPASVTGILDRLEQGGFVRRVKDPDDGRRILVVPNPEGFGEMGRLFEGLMRRLGALYDEYSTEELAAFARFYREVAVRQRAATAELHGDGGGEASEGGG